MILTENKLKRLEELFNNIPDENWNKIEEYLNEYSNDNLTKEKIDKYGFEFKITKPDWDDTQITYTLNNGIQLSALTQSSNSPCDVDSLEGLDGCIYITTVSELEKLNNMTYKDVINDVAQKYPDFDVNEWL